MIQSVLEVVDWYICTVAETILIDFPQHFAVLKFPLHKCTTFRKLFLFWENILFEKYQQSLQFGQIPFCIWTNTISFLDKYNLVYGQIQFGIWTNSPDVVVEFSLEVCPPRVAIFYSRTKPGKFWQISIRFQESRFADLFKCKSCISPVVGFLLTSLCLAGAVCHKRVRLIANPLRLRSRRVGAGERKRVKNIRRFLDKWALSGNRVISWLPSLMVWPTDH